MVGLCVAELFLACKRYWVSCDVWKSNVRSAMRAASQLGGGKPTDVDDAPASAL